MKKILKSIIILVIFITIVVIVGLIVSNTFFKLDIPNISSEKLDFGNIIKDEEVRDNYEIYTQKIESKDFINLAVNSYIDNLVEEFKNNNLSDKKIIFSKDKAVFKQIIDTYKVNDDLVSVKITSIFKKNYQKNYTTKIYAYNFSNKDEIVITLDDLFKNGYKNIIPDNSYDSFLLKYNDIELYTGIYKKNVSYNSLLEYNASKKINAQNFNITQEEYENLFSNQIDKNKKMVAITFDDGPHATNTYKILDILDANNAKATFFMLGSNVLKNNNVVKSVYDRGNEIGIHTWNHKELTKLSSEQIKNEVDSTSDAIFNITGERPTLVRPPYGSVNSTVKSVLSNYTIVLWNIDSLDWKSRDEKKIVPLVMNDIKDGDIILLHDIHSTTIPAVEKIVKQLKEQDYELVTVSDMLEAKGYDTASTKLFYSARQ